MGQSRARGAVTAPGGLDFDGFVRHLGMSKVHYHDKMIQGAFSAMWSTYPRGLLGCLSTFPGLGIEVSAADSRRLMP